MSMVVPLDMAADTMHQARLTHVFAEISNKPVKLVEYLIRMGLINEDQLERALRKKPKNKRLGNVLVEDGVIEEAALRTANLKFEQRFRQVECVLQTTGGIDQAGPAEMDAAWEAVKRAEKDSG